MFAIGFPIERTASGRFRFSIDSGAVCCASRATGGKKKQRPSNVPPRFLPLEAPRFRLQILGLKKKRLLTSSLTFFQVSALSSLQQRRAKKEKQKPAPILIFFYLQKKLGDHLQKGRNEAAARTIWKGISMSAAL